MRSATALAALVSSAFAALQPHRYTYYSYIGSDPAAWTRSAIGRPSAVGPAAGYTTFIGDTRDYRVAQITTDAAQNTYVAGSRIVIPSGPGALNRLSDVFVTKLDPSGNVVFTATIGGKGDDEAQAIAIDPAGNIYVAGSTTSPNFPLHNALQNRLENGPGSQATGFLVKFSPDGSRLIYSTYFGGSIAALTADAAGNVYLTGSTNASDFPQTPGLRGARLSVGPGAVSGAFITKISPAGDRIIYSDVIAGYGLSGCAGSTCFLSERRTGGAAIALDASGGAYIAGNTDTTDLPTTPGAFFGGGIGAFVAKVNTAGTALVYLTYIGGSRYLTQPFPAVPANIVNGLTVDGAGNAYLAGSTTDPKFPATPGVYQTTFSGPGNPGSIGLPPPSDAFVAKLSLDGARMIWATYVGGTAADSAQSIALDSSGNAWVAGTTASPEFPNSNGWSQGRDFLIELNPSASALLYSARFLDTTAGQSVVVDSAGLVHFAGSGGTVSAIVPGRPPPMQIFTIGNAAGGLLLDRIAPGELISIYGPHIGPSAPATFTLDGSGLVPKSLAGVQVFFNDTAAPLLYVSDTQINAIAPFELSGQDSARVRVSRSGAVSPDFPVAVIPAAPEVFRNPDGSAAAVNEDGTINSPDHPTRLSSVISIWATGTGVVPAADGQIATSAQNYCFCNVRLEDQFADLLYAGSAPSLVAGVSQINFRLPANPSPGTDRVYFVISAGGQITTSSPAWVHVTK